jgi:hypothetical protein
MTAPMFNPRNIPMPPMFESDGTLADIPTGGFGPGVAFAVNGIDYYLADNDGTYYRRDGQALTDRDQVNIAAWDKALPSDYVPGGGQAPNVAYNLSTQPSPMQPQPVATASMSPQTQALLVIGGGIVLLVLLSN